MHPIRSVRARVAIGIAAGVIAGALGPTMSAVAGKSGNREPEPASATATQSLRRGATSSHAVDLGSKVRSTHLYVWTELAGTAAADTTTQSAWRDWRGEAVAIVETCTKATRVCTTKTYRGPIGGIAPSGAATGGNSYTQEPALRAAMFSGALKQGTSSCTFDLRWLPHPTDTAPDVVHPSVGADPDAYGPDASASTRRSRWSSVTFASSCYPAATATGSVWETIEGNAHTTRR